MKSENYIDDIRCDSLRYYFFGYDKIKTKYQCEECKYQSNDAVEFFITGSDNQHLVCKDCNELGNNLMESKY